MKNSKRIIINHNKGLFYIIIILIIILIGIIYLIIKEDNNIKKEVKNDTDKDLKNLCNIDSDCIQDSCCHANSCINKGNAPDCNQVICTQECRSLLDCNRGYCTCKDNKCVVTKK